MNNLRLYGQEPYSVAVLHGGPGAAGEMAPVAKELSNKGIGVLEPLQTANSVQGQLDELEEVLRNNADVPVVLIGYSWGAMLGYIFASKYPKLVKKLILVSSGVFESEYAKRIMPNRLSHLTPDEGERLKDLFLSLATLPKDEQDEAFKQIGELTEKSDNYDRIDQGLEGTQIEVNAEIYEKVWGEAEKLRGSGELLAYGKNITCPVIAIHGDYDPHPLEGIRDPLQKTLKDFRFIVLEHSGHTPWIERQSAENFYKVLEEEIKS